MALATGAYAHVVGSEPIARTRTIPHGAAGLKRLMLADAGFAAAELDWAQCFQCL
jgi:hypothetical protein